MTDSAPNLLRAALEYAQRGWAIFPLRPRDKTPLTPNGLKNASTNPDTIRRWWGQHPQANIGLSCGASGLVVVDLDKRDDRDGVAEWLALLKAHGLESTATAVSLTGGGGRHLLFSSNGHGPIKNSAGKLAGGIDVRGEGGYIVLPPSIHPSGRAYEWQDTELVIAPLPHQLAELLQREPDPWTIYTLRDAFEPRPPLTWLVAGLVPASSLSIWYGAPGTLKSLLLADLCVSVAAGHRWLAQPQALDTSGRAVTPAPVMWLDFDNGQRRTHERFAALARARNLPESAPVYYASFPTPPLQAGDTLSMRELAARLANRGVQLVVVDNLRTVSGGLDENSGDMQAPMDGLRWLAEAGLAVIVIHHQRKAGVIGGRAGEALRGHSCIEGAIDLALLITREDNDVTATSTKTRGADVKPFSARFEFESDDRHELTRARFWPVDQEAVAAAEQAETKADILAFLKKRPYQSANAVCNFIGGNKKQMLDLLRRMQMDGEIQARQGAGLSLQLYVQE